MIRATHFGLHAVVRAPGMDPLKIPLAAQHTTIDDVTVWEWSGSAYDEGDGAAEWFSAYLGKPSRLVRFKQGSVSQNLLCCLLFFLPGCTVQGYISSPLRFILSKSNKTICHLRDAVFPFLQPPKLDRPTRTMLKVTKSCSLMASQS